MRIEFYIKGQKDVYEHCNQDNVPRRGDGLVLDEQLYTVSEVIWYHDDRVIKITLEKID